MDLAKIKKLLAIVAESEIAEVEIEEEGLKVVVRKSAPTVTMQQQQPFPPYGFGYYAPPPPPVQGEPASARPFPAAPTTGETSVQPAAAPPAEPSGGDAIRAPIVGTFYRASSPESDPFVSVGDHVQPGDVLCIIEAMKLMNEIESEVSGTVVKVLVENAEAVEYDQPLFIIKPD